MIEFDLDLPDVIHHLKQVEEKIILLSTRHAINKALRASREDANTDFKKRYGIGKDRSKPNLDKLIESRKANMASLRGGKGAFILAESHPISLIHFVMGPKRAQRLKGVPLHKRRRVYVNVARVSQLKKSFIDSPKKFAGGTQVFSWGEYKGTRRPIKQTLPHALSVMMRKELAAEMSDKAEAVFHTEFEKRFAREMERLNRY